jgi:hypothetical protein
MRANKNENLRETLSPVKNLAQLEVASERRLELPRYSQTHQGMKIMAPRLSNGSSHFKLIQQSSNSRVAHAMSLATKSSAMIKVHKDFFGMFDNPEHNHTQNLFGITSRNKQPTKHGDQKATLPIRNSQNNIDVFNLNLVTKGGCYAQNENRLPAMPTTSRKLVRVLPQVKASGKSTADNLQLIKEFVQANNFV